MGTDNIESIIVVEKVQLADRENKEYGEQIVQSRECREVKRADEI